MLDLMHATMTTEARAIVTVRGYGFCPDVILDRFHGAQSPHLKMTSGNQTGIFYLSFEEDMSLDIGYVSSHIRFLFLITLVLSVSSE